ncbi:MAG TPA: hypothetical protein VFI02_06620 [Armatimonadota bacterium]|nr:hypothetical protein [Armatimonadota bacterium]
MRSFRRCAARWPISVFCIVSFMSPIIGTVLTPLPALAQAGTIEVAVVDFRNNSKMPNEMFGTMATDAVVVELLRSGKFGVTPADGLQAAMEALGYKSKEDRTLKVAMTPSMMVRLGQELGGVDGVVHGEITSIKVDSGKKKAEVRLVVRTLHVASGEWSNGAIAIGMSNPRIGYSADKDTDLIIEAINDAARQAVESMVQYIIPEATIIGTFSPTEVLLNKGAQEGIKSGMEMIALRRSETGEDEVVGRIKITKLGDNDSHGTVVSTTRGLKPEDRVRAVYELPLETGKAQAKPLESKNRIAKGGKLLWGLIALVGLATLFKGGGEQAEGVPGTVAMAGKTPDVVSPWSNGGILVAWNTPKGVRATDIIEFHVWRDNLGSITSQYGSGDNVNCGPVINNDPVTAVGISGAIGSYDHSTIDDTYARDPGFDYVVPSSDHTDLDSRHYVQTGLSVGTPHQYWVTCVYRRHGTDNEGAAVVTYWETQGSYAGRATYLRRPECDAPGGIVASEYVDLSNVTFSWRGCAGADQYVIEVSPTPDFKRDETWVDVVYQPTPADLQLFTKTYTLRDADSGTTVAELANVLAGGTLYWRVGARNRTDAPGPYPAGPSPQVDGPKNTRYMYCDMNQYYSFMTLPDMPEPPPDSDGGDNGGNTPPSPPSL